MVVGEDRVASQLDLLRRLPFLKFVECDNVYSLEARARRASFATANTQTQAKKKGVEIDEATETSTEMGHDKPPT